MPMKLSDYGPGWKEFSAMIRARAFISINFKEMCECMGECGQSHAGYRCTEEHLQPAKTFKGRVVLTVAHLCMTPKCRAMNHVRAMCQRCHLAYDRPHRKKEAKP